MCRPSNQPLNAVVFVLQLPLLLSSSKDLLLHLPFLLSSSKDLLLHLPFTSASPRPMISAIPLEAAADQSPSKYLNQLGLPGPPFFFCHFLPKIACQAPKPHNLFKQNEIELAF
jgi:hypothetical protein